MDQDAELVFDEKGPERTCIVTRSKGSPQTMLRFVVGPDGAVVPDLRGRLPGRGAWVTAEAALVETAVKRHVFRKAFKRDVMASADLSVQVRDLMVSDALAALSLANKAGLVVAGAAKVEGALASGGVAALFHATDGSPDGIRKLDAAARRNSGPDGPEISRLQIFASSQLDLALGRSNVIHGALLVGGASGAFLEKAMRLQGYSGAGAPQRTGFDPDPEMRPS